ncbi:MAG: helix-turn-helix domain-containing protein [Oscillospiraceae bacterium]
MKNYFKIPNNIFSLSLNYREILILTYLISIAFKDNIVIVKQSKIAEKLGYSTTNSVSKILRSLKEKGFIKIKSNYKNKKRTTNSYTINPQLLLLDKGFFIVNRRLFSSLNLKKTSMVTYLYILRCSNNYISKNSAFPSLSKISRNTNISQVSVVNAIKDLVNNNLINKVNKIKNDTSYATNMYIVLEILKTKKVEFKIKKIKIFKKLKYNKYLILKINFYITKYIPSYIIFL